MEKQFIKKLEHSLHLSKRKLMDKQRLIWYIHVCNKRTAAAVVVVVAVLALVVVTVTTTSTNTVTTTTAAAVLLLQTCSSQCHAQFLRKTLQGS